MRIQDTILGTVAYLGGVPSLPEYFTWSWSNLIQHNTRFLCNVNERIFYDRALQSFHANARNDLVKRMRGEWLLQLDTDHLFEPDLLVRLLGYMDKHNLDVVTGVYQYKEHPYSPVLYRFTDRNEIVPVGDWDPQAELMQIDSAGAGCLLVKRTVFEQIIVQTGEWPFENRPGLTEDHSFFVRLKEAGLKAYCALQVECHHVRPHALSIHTDYQRERVQLGTPYARSGL